MPRLAQVTIENFQSLERVCLELDRLTVITGHSGSGKSAVVRALSAAFLNRQGGGFVREGAEASRVTLHFGAGAEVTWTKPRKGGARYDLLTDAGSAVITRVGRETAPEIQAITGVWEVECEGVREAPQIDSQFSPPFLLAETGGAAAKLLAKVSKLDVLLIAQIAAKRDADRTKKDHDDAAAAADRLRGEIVAMPDYARLLDEWKVVAAQVDDLSRRAESLGRARQLVDLRSRAERQASASSTAQVAPRITALRDGLGPLETAARLIGELQRVRRDQDRVEYDLSAAAANKKKADAELHDLLGEMDVCPICGLEMETWKPVPVDGFEQVYEVSSLGRVRRTKAGQGSGAYYVLKGRSDGHKCNRVGCNGWFAVALYHSGRRVQRKVHQLVSEAFLGPRPEGCEPNHKDGDGTNNAAQNLEWVTRSENIQHAYDELGKVRLTGEANPSSKVTIAIADDIRRERRAGVSRADLRKRYGLGTELMAEILRGKKWLREGSEYSTRNGEVCPK